MEHVRCVVVGLGALGSATAYQLARSGVQTVYTADTGIVHASRSVAALEMRARAHGASLRDRCAVTGLSFVGDLVVLATAGGPVSAERVVLCTDAWINKLLEPLGAAVPLVTMQEQVTLLAELATTGTTGEDVSLFGADRPALGPSLAGAVGWSGTTGRHGGAGTTAPGVAVCTHGRADARRPTGSRCVDITAGPSPTSAVPLLLRNARMPGQTQSRDVLLADGVVAAIVPAGSALPSSSPVRQLDLDGRQLLPGLWDEHVHFTQWALTRRRLDVSAATSAASAAELVRQRILSAGPPADGPLVGYGFRDGLWPDEPSAAMLDAAGQGAAVVLVSADLHCLWLSSAAAQHFAAATDATGLLREDAAFRVNGLLAEVPAGVLDGWAGEAAAAAAARGVVGIVDLEMDWNAEVWVRRVTTGIDVLRVETGVYTEDLDRAIEAGLATGTPVEGGRGLVVAGPFKILIDGSLNTRTAYCFDPYPGGSHGMLTVQPEDLLVLMRRAAAAGITCAVHAIGDRANALALDAFAALGRPGRIEHAQLVAPEDFARFAALGVVASVQPGHATADRDVADLHWHGRTGAAFALRSLRDHGAALAFGSDAPVTPLDPWPAIAAAVSRTEDDQPPWHPEQRIDLPTALQSSARGRSRVEVGQPADLVAVDLDPGTCAVQALRAMPVALTVLGGATTYSAIG